MRITICDVCDEKFDPDEAMLQVLVPTEFLNTDGDALMVDVCGWACMNQMVDNFLNQSVEEQEEKEVKPTEKPFIMVPKTPTIDTDMDEKAFAQYTESVTGVKRRT